MPFIETADQASLFVTDWGSGTHRSQLRGGGRGRPQWCADFEAAGPYFGSSPGSSPGLIDWTTRMIVETPTHVLLETLKINADVDMRDELGKLQLPVLIIHDDQDASAPLELTGRKTAALISDATLVVYPGAGHGLYASDHDAVNADILAFIHGRPG